LYKRAERKRRSLHQSRRFLPSLPSDLGSDDAGAHLSMLMLAAEASGAQSSRRTPTVASSSSSPPAPAHSRAPLPSFSWPFQGKKEGGEAAHVLRRRRLRSARATTKCLRFRPELNALRREDGRDSSKKAVPAERLSSSSERYRGGTLGRRLRLRARTHTLRGEKAVRREGKKSDDGKWEGKRKERSETRR
jgi:hypothetical protein